MKRISLLALVCCLAFATSADAGFGIFGVRRVRVAVVPRVQVVQRVQFVPVANRVQFIGNGFGGYGAGFNQFGFSAFDVNPNLNFISVNSFGAVVPRSNVVFRGGVFVRIR